MTLWFSFNLNCSLQLRSWHFGGQNAIMLFSWTYPTWLVALMSVNRETGAWFGELSWHLKVPWKLISAKRIPIHRAPMQIKGGTAAVGGFLFRRQWRYDSVSIWIVVCNCGGDILVDKTQSCCSRGHTLRDWSPWCLWIVKQGLGLENCLDTLRFLGN